MRRSFASRLAPLTICVVVAACSGSSKSADVSTGPSTMPSAPAPSPSPGDQPAPSPPAPGPTSCSPSVTGLPASVSADAGRYSFSVVIGSSCDWTARTDALWADVAPGSGRGNATLTLTVAQNTRIDDSRTATITVNSVPVRVTQNRFSCSYALDRTSLDQGPGGGNVRITVTTSDWCPWTATASEDWIRVLTPSGTGSAAVSVDLLSNSVSSDRRGFLTIAGLRVDVLQRRND